MEPVGRRVKAQCHAGDQAHRAGEEQCPGMLHNRPAPAEHRRVDQNAVAEGVEPEQDRAAEQVVHIVQIETGALDEAIEPAAKREHNRDDRKRDDGFGRVPASGGEQHEREDEVEPLFNRQWPRRAKPAIVPIHATGEQVLGEQGVGPDRRLESVCAGRKCTRRTDPGVVRGHPHEDEQKHEIQRQGADPAVDPKAEESRGCRDAVKAFEDHAGDQKTAEDEKDVDADEAQLFGGRRRLEGVIQHDRHDGHIM